MGDGVVLNEEAGDCLNMQTRTHEHRAARHLFSYPKLQLYVSLYHVIVDRQGLPQSAHQLSVSCSCRRLDLHLTA